MAEARAAPEAVLERYRADPAFQYQNPDAERPSLWDRIKAWIFQNVLAPLLRGVASDGGEILLITLAALGLAWVITRLLRADVGPLFGRKDLETAAAHGPLLDVEDIREVDVDSLLRDALARGLLRDAVRFRYVLALQSLAQRRRHRVAPRQDQPRVRARGARGRRRASGGAVRRCDARVRLRVVRRAACGPHALREAGAPLRAPRRRDAGPEPGRDEETPARCGMKGRGLLWALLCGAGLIVLMVLSTPAQIDTRVRLEREGAAPFDAEVFYAALPEWMGTTVTPVNEPPYSFLADTTLTNTTYLFLAREFAPGEPEAERLLRFVARGNTVFVAAHALGGPFFEALGSADSSYDDLVGLRTEWPSEFPWIQNGQVGREDTLRLVIPGQEGAYGFTTSVHRASLYGLDSSRTELLGLSASGDNATLARVRYGEGTVVVSSTPIVFTNAALTGEGDAEAYISAVLATLPQQPILWDDYGKPFRQQAQTPLRYILTTPPLAWAYWLMLLFVGLLIVFRGRRWQRAIPVVSPPPNAQREFARTVGRLHFTHGDTRRLVESKTRVFLDRLRTRLRLADPDLSEETARRAAPRAGVPEAEAVGLFARLRRLQIHSQPPAADLVDLDARLSRFFRHVDAPARSASGAALSGATASAAEPDASEPVASAS